MCRLTALHERIEMRIRTNKFIKRWVMSRKGIASMIGLTFILSIYLYSCSATLSQTELMRKGRIESSPQWKEGKFVNRLARKDTSVWSMISKQFSNDQITSPEEPITIRKRMKGEFQSKPDHIFDITWLGHSTVLIEMEGLKILTDPVWGKRTSPISFIGPKRFFQPPLAMDQLPDIDVVAISHDHYDHLDEESIKGLIGRAKIFIAPLGVGNYLEEWGVPYSQIVELDWWEDYNYRGVTFTSTPARHFSGRSALPSNHNKTLWCGWAMNGKKHSLYYSGDTAMFPQFKDIGERLGPFDITMIEVGAYSNMWRDVHIGPEQAIEAHKLVKGKVLLPVHWGTFNLSHHGWTEPIERVIEASKKGDVKVITPRPGESYRVGDKPVINRWWPDVKWLSSKENPIKSSGLD